MKPLTIRFLYEDEKKLNRKKQIPGEHHVFVYAWPRILRSVDFRQCPFIHSFIHYCIKNKNAPTSQVSMPGWLVGRELVAS